MEPVEQTGPESVVFRAGRGGNQRECLPTAYKPQLITRRPPIQVQPPQPNKKGTPDFPGCFCFRNYDGKNDLQHHDPIFRGTPENCSPQGRFPHKRPSLTVKKGGQNGESAALPSLTQKPMKLWFHRFFARNRGVRRVDPVPSRRDFSCQSTSFFVRWNRIIHHKERIIKWQRKRCGNRPVRPSWWIR